MIPKIIHWCWLSNDPVPDNLQKCMDTWKVHLPDYKFIHWNFERFPKGTSKWVDDAFANKKYAFAADYIRLYAIYNYGGIYLDMDVEVCKSFDPFLNLKTMLCWQSYIGGLEVAAFGAEKGAKWVKDCLDAYDVLSFVKDDGSFDMLTLPTRIEQKLHELNYYILDCDDLQSAMQAESQGAIPVFPSDYFSPKSYLTGKVRKTKRTVSIHHFAGSWSTPQKLPCYLRLKEYIWRSTGLADLQIKKRLGLGQ